MYKTFLLILFFGMIQYSTNSQTQTTEIQIDKKHTAIINLTTSDGSTHIPDGYYANTDTLTFVLSPKGDWDFNKKYRKELDANLTINRSSSSYSKNIGILGKSNAYGDIDRFCIWFKLESINIREGFTLEYKTSETNLMKIPQKCWPYFPEFIQYYNKGKAYKEEKRWIDAFDQLQHLLTGSPHYKDFEAFDDYNIATEMISDVVDRYLIMAAQNIQLFEEKIGNLELITEYDLKEIKLFYDTLVAAKTFFEPFYKEKDYNKYTLSGKHSELIRELDVLYKTTYDRWKDEVFLIMVNGNYNSTKYKVYIDLLARMLVYTNRIDTLSKFDSINIGLITNIDVDFFFKMQLAILSEYNDQGWENDFITLLQILNEEIRNNHQLVSQEILDNLSRNHNNETQPNYYIIVAFNELVKNDKKTFQSKIISAMNECTDKEMLYYFEMWNFSYRYFRQRVNYAFIEYINNGLNFDLKNVDEEEASKYYEKAAGLDPEAHVGALPNFLLGKLNLDEYIKDVENNIKQFYDATNHLKKALKQYPEFALARIYNIELIIAEGEYKQALSKIEDALNTNSQRLRTWYIFYLKAKVLYYMEDYSQSLEVIENDCQRRNNNNVGQLLLLGDIYGKLGECDTARDFYDQVWDLDNDNDQYQYKKAALKRNCDK